MRTVVTVVAAGCAAVIAAAYVLHRRRTRCEVSLNEGHLGEVAIAGDCTTQPTQDSQPQSNHNTVKSDSKKLSKQDKRQAKKDKKNSAKAESRGTKEKEAAARKQKKKEDDEGAKSFPVPEGLMDPNADEQNVHLTPAVEEEHVIRVYDTIAKQWDGTR